MNRDTQGRFASAQQSINDERFTIDLQSISFKRVVIEMAIGFVYGYALGCAFNWVMGAVMLLGMPVFLNFAIWFALLMLSIGFVWATAPMISNFVYEQGARAIATTCEGVVRAKDFVVDHAPRVTLVDRVKRAYAAF